MRPHYVLLEQAWKLWWDREKRSLNEAGSACYTKRDTKSMLIDTQCQDVGERWLSAEIRACYFADLCSRYLSRQRWLTWATLLCSSGTATTVLASDLPQRWQSLRPILALLTTALSVLTVVQQNAKASADCAELHFTWNHLANLYEMLWHDMDSNEAEDQLKNLIEKSAEASKRGTAIPYREKIMVKWQKHVEMHHSDG
jgi:hypothetical protein